jgi:hypothetical protein
MPVLFSFYFIIQQKIIRHRMEEKLEASLLQTIHLKKENWVWIKKNKEIRVGNHLFDVKSIKEKNGYFEINGLYDEQEDFLQGQLDNMNRDQNPPSQKDLLNFFFHLCYLSPHKIHFESEPITESAAYSCYFSLYLPSPVSELLSPPPES